jgi:hypothetical protein
MHPHLPKPLHGWRELVGEVGIIVLAVLIALGAEQVVADIHWHRELSDTRDALRAELKHDIGAIKFSTDRDPCIERRLNQLDGWLAQARHRQAIPLTHAIGRPSQQFMWTSVWDTVKSGDVASHMQLKERLAYARTYSLIDNVAKLLDRQRDGWWALGQFNGAPSLDHSDQMRLEQLVTTLRSTSILIVANANLILPQARAMHLTAEQIPAYSPAADKSFCEPLTKLSGGSS